MARVHSHAGYAAPNVTRSLCGHLAVLTTEDEALVTCQACKRRMRMAARERQVVAGGHLYSGQRLRDLRDGMEGLASQLAGEWMGSRRAARLATRWASIGHALAEMVAVDNDGPGGASMSDPERIELLSGRLGGNTTRSSVTSVERQADDLHTVRAAWRVCWDSVDTRPMTLVEAQGCTLLRYVGGQSEDGERRVMRPGELSDFLRDERGAEVTPRSVGRVTGRAGQLVYEYLRERGLIPEHRPYSRVEGSQESKVLGYDYTGWKEICDALAVSRNTAMRWAEREDDPLPVDRIGGILRAKRAELEAWIAREAERNRGAA